MDCSILQASDKREKKVKFCGIFRDRFTEIFGASFSEKQTVKNGQFVAFFWANLAKIDQFYANLMFFNIDNHLLF